MDNDIIGKPCFIKHRNGSESFAGVALEIVERGTTLVRFDKAKLLWPIDQVIVSREVDESCTSAGRDEHGKSRDWSHFSDWQ